MEKTLASTIESAQTEVPMQLEYLNDNVNRLTKAVIALVEKLEPVLPRPELLEESHFGNKESSITSPLGTKLQSLNRDIGMQIDVIQHINSLIQL